MSGGNGKIQAGWISKKELMFIIIFYITGCHSLGGFLSIWSPCGISFEGQNYPSLDPKCVSATLMRADTTFVHIKQTSSTKYLW